MYRPHLRVFFLLFLAAAAIPLSGCLFRTRTVDRPLSDRPLKTSTQQETDRLCELAGGQDSVHAGDGGYRLFGGRSEKRKVTDYKEIRGYVLARKPAMLRMKGLMPVVRTTAFDMVSDGKEFKLWIPPRNKFVMGANDAGGYHRTSVWKTCGRSISMMRC